MVQSIVTLSFRDMLINMSQGTNPIDTSEASDTAEGIFIPTVSSDDDEEDIDVHIAAITERKSQAEVAANELGNEENESDDQGAAPGINSTERQIENQAAGPVANLETAEPQAENQAGDPIANPKAAPGANPAVVENEELPIPELKWKLERVFENKEECDKFIAAEGCRKEIINFLRKAKSRNTDAIRLKREAHSVQVEFIPPITLSLTIQR